MTAEPVGVSVHEEDNGDTGSRLNWLRAGVLGANDGIVSTGSLVVGVAAAQVQEAREVAARLLDPAGDRDWGERHLRLQ